MDQQLDIDRDELIEGHLTLALSGIGVENFMQRGQKLRKFRFFDGSEEFGMEVQSISFRSLQKMAMTGLVYKMEVSVASFAAQRRHIMELTKCFAIATVYRQFETRLWEIISHSDLLVQWNRAYPRLTIGAGLNTNAQTFQMLIEKSKDGIMSRKQEVLRSTQIRISQDQKTLADEKKALTLLAIRYINAIDPVIWLLVSASKDSISANQLVSELQKLLLQYVARSELPEYLALMLVELVVVVGGVHSADGSGQSISDSTSEEDEKVFISYELGSVKRSQEERTRMRIQIGNEARDFGDLRSKLDHQAQVDIREKSLDVFFGLDSSKSSTLASAAGKQDLGMYYLSYLKEACKKMDISIDSFVNVIPHTNRTLINLILAI